MSENEQIYPRFKGKSILVTGGAGNIGKATAIRFAKEGANVAIVDLPSSPLEQAVKDISAFGTKVISIAGDVTKADQVQNYVNKTKEAFGKIDFFFNNAGYQGQFVVTQDYPEDDFRSVLDVNVTGVFLGLKYVSQVMIAQGGGVIVNTASMAGINAPPNMIAYAASKFAVIGITKTAAKDLACHNIRVCTICPMFIGPEDGKMWISQASKQAAVGSQYYDADPEVVKKQMINSTPMRRLGTLEEVAASVSFLCSADASYLTGNVIKITGGGE